jgi:periplasmic copper chaperone A
MGMRTKSNVSATNNFSGSLMRRRSSLVLGALAVMSAGILTMGAAQAHIDPKPATVAAGAKTEVSFSVGHGCGASPTTKLQIKVPAGVTVSSPRGPSSMVASVSGGVVTFDGVAAGKNRKVFLTLQFPKTPGLLSFPVVQTCKTGKESWIEIPNAANPKPKLPAPQIMVK